MQQKQQVLLGYFSQGKSIKKLSRDLGIARNTVRTYIREHEDENGLESKRAGPESRPAIPPSGVVSLPSYESSNRKNPRLTLEIKTKVDAYLAENKAKRESLRSKQQMKGMDIHEALLEQGHKLGYSTLTGYIREAEKRAAEVFIRQDHPPGKSVQFDWGEAKLTIDGKLETLELAVFTSSNSNHRWARLFRSQDMNSFLHSHACYFSAVGGVPAEMLYDNMKVAVRKYVIRNSDKKPTDSLLKMSIYYGFDFRFCNARKGNEKGKVERSVEYTRRKAFSRKDDFGSLEQANIHLEKSNIKLNQLPAKGEIESIQTHFEEELKVMKQPPATPFDTSELRTLKVDKYSSIRVDTNSYSVPGGFVGTVLDVKIYPDYIKIYDPKNQCLATHERRTGRHGYFLELGHYLKTLRYKPGALRGSVAFLQASQVLKDIYYAHFEQEPKEFVELLLYMREKDYSIQELQNAVEKCLKSCPHRRPELDKLKVLIAPQPQLEQPDGDEGIVSKLSQNITDFCNSQLQTAQDFFISNN